MIKFTPFKLLGYIVIHLKLFKYDLGLFSSFFGGFQISFGKKIKVHSYMNA